MEFISLRPNITEDFIFSKINQESIMQHYTGLDVNSKKLFLSPVRNDNKITCAFYKSKSGILYLHDFATNEHLNCWNIVMKMFNCNYYQALKIVAQDFGLIDGTHNSKVAPTIVPTIKSTKSSKIQVQIKDYTKEELKWWEQFGISKKLLKKYKIYSLQYVFLNGELRFTSVPSCPIYGYYFGKDKNSEEKWKIYFPLKTEYRFLNNLSKKVLQGYHQLPKTGDLLVITKSMKDCMTFYSYGISAIAPSSESTFCSDKQIEEFKQRFKHIIVIYDQDRAGKHNMYKIRSNYPELDYFVIPRYLKAKDFSDLRKLYGEEKTREFLNQCLNYFMNKWKE